MLYMIELQATLIVSGECIGKRKRGIRDRLWTESKVKNVPRQFPRLHYKGADVKRIVHWLARCLYVGRARPCGKARANFERFVAVCEWQLPRPTLRCSGQSALAPTSGSWSWPRWRLTHCCCCLYSFLRIIFG